MCPLCPEANGSAIFKPVIRGRQSRSFRMIQTCTTRKNARTAFRHKCSIWTCSKGNSCPPVPDPMPLPSIPEACRPAPWPGVRRAIQGFCFSSGLPDRNCFGHTLQRVNVTTRPPHTAAKTSRLLLPRPTHGSPGCLSLASACSNGRKSSPERRPLVSGTSA